MVSRKHLIMEKERCCFNCGKYGECFSWLEMMKPDYYRIEQYRQWCMAKEFIGWSRGNKCMNTLKGVLGWVVIGGLVLFVLSLGWYMGE